VDVDLTSQDVDLTSQDVDLTSQDVDHTDQTYLNKSEQAEPVPGFEFDQTVSW